MTRLDERANVLKIKSRPMKTHQKPSSKDGFSCQHSWPPGQHTACHAPDTPCSINHRYVCDCRPPALFLNKLAGGYFHDPLEGPAEGVVRGIAHLAGHIPDEHVGAQLVHGLLHPVLLKQAGKA